MGVWGFVRRLSRRGSWSGWNCEAAPTLWYQAPCSYILSPFLHGGLWGPLVVRLDVAWPGCIALDVCKRNWDNEQCKRVELAVQPQSIYKTLCMGYLHNLTWSFTWPISLQSARGLHVGGWYFLSQTWNHIKPLKTTLTTKVLSSGEVSDFMSLVIRMAVPFPQFSELSSERWPGDWGLVISKVCILATVRGVGFNQTL